MLLISSNSDYMTEEGRKPEAIDEKNPPPYKVGWKGQVRGPGIFGKNYHGKVVEVGDDYIVFDGVTIDSSGIVKKRERKKFDKSKIKHYTFQSY